MFSSCRFLHAFAQGNFTAARYLRTTPSRKLPSTRSEKRLDVVIIGPVNAGKSVLLNCLLTHKLAATSHKKNTTRLEIVGVFNHNNTQLAFSDTPGFIRSIDARKKGAIVLRDITCSAALKADVVLLVVDAANDISEAYLDSFAEIVKLGLDNSKIELILVLNKVDLVHPKNELLTITHQLVSTINGVKLGKEKAHLAQLDTTTFMISALKDDGVIDLKNYLLSLALPKPWLVPRGEITSLSEEERVEQIVLEMLLEHTHMEIPYVASITCRPISEETRNLRRLQFDVDIYVDSGSQQRILIGQQGRTLVKIRQSAVGVLEQIYKKRVILFLWAHVRGNETDEDTEANTTM